MPHSHLTDAQKRALIDQLMPGANIDTSGVDISIVFRLDKFDGEYEPGKEPIETIEGGDNRPTTTTRSK